MKQLLSYGLAAAALAAFVLSAGAPHGYGG